MHYSRLISRWFECQCSSKSLFKPSKCNTISNAISPPKFQAETRRNKALTLHFISSTRARAIWWKKTLPQKRSVNTKMCAVSSFFSLPISLSENIHSHVEFFNRHWRPCVGCISLKLCALISIQHWFKMHRSSCLSSFRFDFTDIFFSSIERWVMVGNSLRLNSVCVPRSCFIDAFRSNNSQFELYYSL